MFITLHNEDFSKVPFWDLKLMQPRDLSIGDYSLDKYSLLARNDALWIVKLMQMELLRFQYQLGLRVARWKFDLLVHQTAHQYIPIDMIFGNLKFLINKPFSYL